MSATILTPPRYRLVNERAGIIADNSEPPLSEERVERLRSYLTADLVQVYFLQGGDVLAEGFPDPVWIYTTPGGSAWWLVRSSVAEITLEDHSVNRIMATVEDGDTDGQQRTPLLGIDSDGRLIASAMPIWPRDPGNAIAHLPAMRSGVAAWVKAQVSK